MLLLTLTTMATPTSDNVTETYIYDNVSTTSGKSPSSVNPRSSGYSSYYVSPTLDLVLYIATIITVSYTHLTLPTIYSV